MNIKDTPAYAYFPGVTRNYQVGITYCADQDLYDRLQAWDDPSHYGQGYWQYDYTNPESIVGITDNLFMTNILSRGLKYYQVNDPSIPSGQQDAYEDCLKCYNRVYNDLNAIPITLNVSNSNYDTNRVVTLNNIQIGNTSINNNSFESYTSGINTYYRYYTNNSTGLRGVFSFCPHFNIRITISYTDLLHRADVTISGRIPVLPGEKTLFNSDGSVNTDLPNNNPCIQFEITYKMDTLGNFACDFLRVVVYKAGNIDYSLQSFKILMAEYNDNQSGSADVDSSNPYGKNGYSDIGGGNGTLLPGGLDSIDPAEIPDLPTIGATDLGFITMYNPTAAQLKSLSQFMWSGVFDLDTYKKLFSDPMQSIIGLAIVPVQPNTGSSKNVMFGTIDSGISMTTISSQYVQLDCGSVAVEKYIGCFLDNDPYTKISIYLPYIGIRQLSADDVIGGSIQVVYNIDVLTGACGCFIKHSSRGVLYSYNGSCITNIALTAANFSGAIQNAVSAVISGIGTVAGMATGAAPITAMGVTGLLNSAANTALNAKPSVQRSGNLGGSAGIMSIQKPYVIIERPSFSVPEGVENFVGQTSNITATLGNVRGFTVCEYIHMQGCWGTIEECKEIESLLKEGVVL